MLVSDSPIKIFLCGATFCFPSTSSMFRMGILHAHGHRGPHGSPKMTRDTPRVAAFSLVCLTMLVCDPPTKMSLRKTFFCFLPTSTKSRMGILHTYGHRGPHGGPKPTRDTPCVAAFCFVCRTMLVGDPPIKISLYRLFFVSYPPPLSLGWAYCMPTAIGAPNAAPK